MSELYIHISSVNTLGSNISALQAASCQLATLTPQFLAMGSF